MRLTQVTIQGFRSIPQKLDFYLRSQLTCLVGANEHGKSNILEAIMRLSNRKFDPIDKYSHSTNLSHPHITYILELNEIEKKKLVEKLDMGVKTTTEAIEVISKIAKMLIGSGYCCEEKAS